MPAADPYLIAVGAADLNGSTNLVNAPVIPPFSNSGNGTRNPDLVLTRAVSARVHDATLSG